MPDYDQQQPGVAQLTGVKEVAPDLVLVPNRHADLVPNIRVIGEYPKESSCPPRPTRPAGPRTCSR